jgi:hypothetical protein
MNLCGVKFLVCVVAIGVSQNVKDCYTDANTSGLTAEVKSAGKNDFTFALESRPPSQK